MSTLDLSQGPPGPRIFLDLCCGVSKPLSTAIQALGKPVVAFDILCNPQDDLLDDSRFEQLLKLCASGVVAYGCASPCCSQYSRLKLRNDGGPRALRTPEHLEGIPNLNAADLEKVQASSTMLYRCIICLQLIFLAGGHVHLEQPTNAMSWSEAFVQTFLKLISAHCVSIAACAYGANWRKSWMYASSFSRLTELASHCNHGPQAHEAIYGVSDQTGLFKSRATACYPTALATAFASIVQDLLSDNPVSLSLDQAIFWIPSKPRAAPPFGSEDGGGLPSVPDWGMDNRVQPDVFRSLRRTWVDEILTRKLHKELVAHFASGSKTPPFSEETLAPFRQSLNEFLSAHGLSPDWSIREHQPMALRIMRMLHSIQQDWDVSLFPSLEEGVHTGFERNIPLSNCFPLRSHSARFTEDVPLSAHLSNWNSAESDLDLTRKLVQVELDEGWVFEYQGSLEDAQRDFPLGVSIGKLGVATSPHRPPRLVVDNSVSGLNARCWIPEHSTLPSAKDLLRCWPLREQQGDLEGFSLDIKAAHKRVVIHPSEQGLVGFSLDGKLFFYRVAPFGASFSAAWWSRVGGWLLRFFHQFLWWSHVGLLYVDDFIFFMNKMMMPVGATLICIFCRLCQIPISWGKSELSSSLKWIGWVFHLNSGYIELPKDKLSKLLEYLKELQSASRTSRKTLEKFIGLCMWVTQLFPYMRIWLHHLYHDLYVIPSTLFSLDLAYWPRLPQFLSDELKFLSQPPFTAFPLGGQIISVRHQTVRSLAELQQVRISDKRIWMRVCDPSSGRRKLFSHSHRILNMFRQWIEFLPPLRPMQRKRYWTGTAAADACASGGSCQIGGFIRDAQGVTHWFSEKFEHKDFPLDQVPLEADMQKHIACFETLAQIALLLMTAKTYPSFRIPICLKSLSDNTGAEAGSNRMFSTSFPLCLFLEKLCLFAALTCMEMDVSHIPGAENVSADQLSRWDFITPLPGFELSSRVRIPLSQLWFDPKPVSLHPESTRLLWSLAS